MFVNRHPEYFLTIVREGNISRAAEKLYMTQSSLSQHLQRLEQELGKQLIDRTSIPLVPTPAGRIYLRYLESHAYMYQKMLSDLSGNDPETVSFGIGIWRGGYLLPRILPDYIKAHPQASVRVREAADLQVLLEAIEKDEIQFALRNTGLEGLPSGIVSERIIDEKILLVLPESHPLAERFVQESRRQIAVDLHLLHDDLYISRSLNTPIGRYIDNFLTKNRFLFPRTMTTDNNQTTLQLTAAGIGFCFMLEGSYLTKKVPGLVYIDLNDPELSLPLVFLYKANTWLSPLALDLMERIRSFNLNLRNN